MAPSTALMLQLIVTGLFTLSTADIISPLTYSFSEQGTPGLVLGEVPSDSGLTAMYGSAAVQQMTFAFVDETDPHLDMFFLNADGQLSTARAVDRDVMCEHQESCDVELSIRAQSEDVFHILQLIITIEDINDNVPIFPGNLVAKSLSESSTPGSMFTIPAATDPDSPGYSVARYQLLTGTTDFRLVESMDTPLWTQENIYLSLLQKLDREQQDFYSIQVMVVDGTGQSDTITVEVTVTDINDNNPKFRNETYRVTVDENLPTNTKILQVKANDPDEGDNGVIVYQFSSKTQSDYGSIFSVDSSTGEVFLTGELDYEDRPSYTLTISAQDLNPGSLPDITHVTIQVSDLNDNAPKIKLITDGGVDEVHLSESKAINSFVAHVRVTDADSSMNGQFQCVLDHHVFELQQLYTTEFKIVTKQPIDRELEMLYNLRIHCIDEGSPPQASSEYITVIIDDENDNAPIFEPQFYEKTVRENSPEMALLQVKATDPDQGDNGRISFHIDPSIMNLLQIDEITGLISSFEPLDRERGAQLVFTVMASDHGESQMTSSVQVVINIEDEDDSDPTFSLMSYVLDVDEHLPAHSEVGQVLAVDEDSNLFNMFTYSLRFSYGQDEMFEVSPDNGTIYTLSELDREEKAFYNMVVMATSYGTSRPVSSSVMVTVAIGDVNDNSPTVIFPSPSNNTIRISGDLEVGQEIFTIQAQDKDSGSNGEVTYSIVSGNDDNYVRVYERNGTMFVNRNLRGLGDHLLALVIRVQDGGVPRKLTDATLNVLVTKSLLGSEDDGLVSKKNLTVVVSIGCISGLVIVVLLVTVVALLRRRHLRKQRQHKRRSIFEIVVEQKVAEEGYGSRPGSSYGSVPRRTAGRDGTNGSSKPEVAAIPQTNPPPQSNLRSSLKTTKQEKALKGSHPPSNQSTYHPPQQHPGQHPNHATSSSNSQPECDDLSRYRLIYGHQPLTSSGIRDIGDKDSDSGCSADMSHSTDGGKTTTTQEQAESNNKPNMQCPPKPPRVPTEHIQPGVHRPPPPPYPRSSSRQEEETSGSRGAGRRHPTQHPLGPPPPYVPPKNRNRTANNPPPVDRTVKHRPNPALNNAVNSILNSSTSQVLFVGNPEEVHV